MQHLRNVLFGIPIAVVKQDVKVHGPLVLGNTNERRPNFINAGHYCMVYTHKAQ